MTPGGMRGQRSRRVVIIKNESPHACVFLAFGKFNHVVMNHRKIDRQKLVVYRT